MDKRGKRVDWFETKTNPLVVWVGIRYLYLILLTLLGQRDKRSSRTIILTNSEFCFRHCENERTIVQINSGHDWERGKMDGVYVYYHW